MSKEIRNVEYSQINISEIHKRAEKQKWMKRFINAYSGEVSNDSTDYYGVNVRFFIALTSKSELGFARINDKSNFFSTSCPFKVWSLTDAYVKPPYRRSGVLRKLIEHLVNECDVRMIYIETARFLKNLSYYQSLGFTNHYTVKNRQLTWAFQDDIWPYVVELNKRNN